MGELKVKSITATVGGPSTFQVDDDGGQSGQIQSASPLIQRLLLDAFFTKARVAVDLVGKTNVIQRVNPFEPAKSDTNSPIPAGGYAVSRLATQRMADGRDEHLEVFIKNGDKEKAYNVYDPMLQQLLEAAFALGSFNSKGFELQVDVNDDKTELFSATVNSVT